MKKLIFTLLLLFANLCYAEDSEPFGWASWIKTENGYETYRIDALGCFYTEIEDPKYTCELWIFTPSFSKKVGECGAGQDSEFIVDNCEVMYELGSGLRTVTVVTKMKIGSLLIQEREMEIEICVSN